MAVGDTSSSVELASSPTFVRSLKHGLANRAWTEIEHDLVEQSVMAPLTNPVTTHAVSDRVGNVQVNPQWGMMPSLMWVQ